MELASQEFINVIKEGSKESTLDVPICLTFWNRPDCLRSLLAIFRQVKPAELFLYQNAPLATFSESKKQAYQDCRRIITDFLDSIDWSCSVHFWFPQNCLEVYSSVCRAIRWAFSSADSCIVLEDDDAPEISWFQLVSILLKKYQNDPKVASITCEVNFGDSARFDDSFDFLFSKITSVHAWASWKRFIDQWDSSYSWFFDALERKKIKRFYGQRYYKRLIKNALPFAQSKIPEYEFFISAARAANESYSIVPTRNMLKYNGMDGEHSAGTELFTKKDKTYFFKKSYPVSFPLREPPYLFHDSKFDQKMLSYASRNFGDSLEKAWLLFKRGQLLRYILHKKK